MNTILKLYNNEANIASNAVPKYVFWVSEYPKTASGKIQKFKLKELGIELLSEGKGETKQ